MEDVETSKTLPAFSDDVLDQMLRDGRFDLEMVVDSVIRVNGFVGVGLIDLSIHVENYIKSKI